MKRDENSIRKILSRYLGRYDEPSREHVASVVEDVWQKLRPEIARTPMSLSLESRPPHFWRFLIPAIAAAGLIILLPAALVRNFVRTNTVHAVVEFTDGEMVRVPGDGKKPLKVLTVGERVEAGEALRLTKGGAVLALADGSRVEMRAQSELSLERADDGVRIRLSTGGVIVTAARQGAGHLYVQTKDVTVSVVGTVFLVNTEEAGSRVAVIQGEVRVQQATTEKKLLPGEQVATNPLMESHPVTEEISWSRNAEAHLALLQQSGGLTAAASSNAGAPSRLEFEVASIRRELPPPRDQVLTAELAGFSCQGIDGVRRGMVGQLPDVAPKGRCLGRSVNLAGLIGYAYDLHPRRVLETPDWRDPGQPLDWGFQIEAAAEIPSAATLAQLKQMLQALLADRFKLKFHRETTECQGYILSVAGKGIKLIESSGDEESPRSRMENRNKLILKGKSSIEILATALSGFVGMPVVDRSGLAGMYDYSLTLNRVVIPALNVDGPRGGGGIRNPDGAGQVCGGTNAPVGARQNQAGEVLTIVGYDPSVPKAVEEQLGLRMDSGKVPVETIVVDHAEKPAGN